VGGRDGAKIKGQTKFNQGKPKSVIITKK